MAMGAGALLVGVAFLTVAHLLHKLPGMWFAAIIPALGVAGFSLVAAAKVRFYGSYLEDVVGYVYTGLIYAYGLTLIGSAILALLHCWLLRLLAAELRVVTPRPLGSDCTRAQE